jgi:hypothetical protein
LSADLASRRQRLWQAYAALGRLLRQLQHTAPLTPGSLYRLRRQCGKPICRCARGHLHETWVLTRSEQGQTKLYSVPPAQHARVRQLTAAYRRYQRARALWVKRAADLLAQIDAFTEVQLVAWPPPPP